MFVFLSITLYQITCLFLLNKIVPVIFFTNTIYNTTNMITLEDFNKIDLRVGTIIDASINKGARKKAYKLKIDFGSSGIKKSSTQITDLYKEE